jgi:hypothetical protein
MAVGGWGRRQGQAGSGIVEILPPGYSIFPLPVNATGPPVRHRAAGCLAGSRGRPKRAVEKKSGPAFDHRGYDRERENGWVRLLLS